MDKHYYSEPHIIRNICLMKGLDQDIAMMKAAGMNAVRIAESTWEYAGA